MSAETVSLDSDSSDDEKERPKVKSSRRRGLAARLAKKENCEPSKISEQSAVYSTRVSKMFNSAIQNIPESVPEDGPFSDEEEDDPLQKRLKESGVKVTAQANVTDPSDLIEIVDEDDIPGSPPRKVTKVTVQSPSPPPPPPLSDSQGPILRKNPRLNRGVKDAMKALSEARDYMHVQEFFNHREQIFDQQNNSDIVCIEDEDDSKITVRVKVFGLKVYRFRLHKFEPLQTVMKDIAAKEKVEEKHLLLVHNDRCIRPTDSPESLKLQVADIIECHESTGEVCDLSTLDESLEAGQDDITIMVQSRQAKQKMEFKISKSAPLNSLITQYAVKMNIDSKKVTLQFDGDNINPGETATDLEVEDGYCIDAIY